MGTSGRCYDCAVLGIECILVVDPEMGCRRNPIIVPGHRALAAYHAGWSYGAFPSYQHLYYGLPWLEMVAMVPSNLVSCTLKGSLYVLALFLRKLRATASPSNREVSVSLLQ